MSPVEYRFLEPLDVLFLRGNKLFGDPGSFGESVMPPWPSVAAGALRSLLLARDGVDLASFADGKLEHPVLGTPSNPGRFAVTAFHVASCNVAGRAEIFVSPPADLILTRDDDGSISPQRLRPYPVTGGIQSSAQLPLLPVLEQWDRRKPLAGYWLRQSGWEKYLNGDLPSQDELLPSSRLWRTDLRIGLALDPEKRRAATGALFSSQAIAMRKRDHQDANDLNVGFLVGCVGAALPPRAVVRLGGDGRSAAMYEISTDIPEADLEFITRTRRCRVILTTPGIFPDGWKLPGTDANHRLRIGDVTARVVCAAVPRYEVVSGWDIARKRPKSAQRAAPAGSVYWLEELEATPQQLRKLAEAGLWTDSWHDAQRRAEGFNRFALAAY
ncbi:MAG: type III-B CRISPR module-associated protein Cmr3 [Steroidobacteraceae bacterium]|nr:type III-B CRISPR module-associated protein Cmr3 [Steroidobacteraceae bacterium]